MEARFLTPSRLNILRQITAGVGSASAIAKATGISLPYVMTQLQLMQAKQLIVTTAAPQQSGPGKPRTEYRLRAPLTHLLLAREGFCERIAFSQAPPSMLRYLQLASFVPQHLSSLSQYYWRHRDAFNKLTALAKISINEHKVEFMAICEPEDLDALRKSISNQTVLDDNDKPIEFVIWVHSPEEIRIGLANNDGYYKSLIERMTIALDEKEVLRGFKHE